ncbi:MAG: MFS transporter [Acidobacteriota bacterium]
MSEDAPYRALRHRDYRHLALSQGVSLIGTQMQVAAINWHVYLLSGSPWALGMIGLTRVAPLILFSLWGGIVADRHDRKRVIFAAQSVLALLACGLAWATWKSHDTLWLVYAVNAVAAAASAFDNPARQALVPRLVPAKQLAGALSLNLSAFNFATIAGPALSGLLLAGTSREHFAGRDSLAIIYALNALSFLGVLIAVATIRTAGTVEPRDGEHPAFFASLREGLQFVFSTPIMIATMALDFFATFWAGSLLLLPIVADQILGVGARGYGFLAAAPAVGALLGSLYTSVRILPKRQGPILLGAVAFYGCATIVVGLSRSFWLTLLALALSGLADVISTVIRQTLRQLLTPDALRGRMTSINMIFFQGGPQLGELEAGLLAGLFASAAVGTTVSIVSGGAMTLVTVLVIDRLAPYVRRYRAPV